MELRCLIVDDEVLAQDVIAKYITTLPTLKLVGRCDNAIEAISFLHNNSVDLLFLDLNMPELSGLEMLKTLSNSPKVIITTAYSEYALESYDYDVVDYLLKPIKLDRFVKAINKVVARSEQKLTEADTSNKQIARTLFIKEDHITHQLSTDLIYYIEAYGNYLKIHTAEKVYVIRETMQDMLEKLPKTQFIRVHKSYIVAIGKINSVRANRVYIDEAELPVGELYKLGLKQCIDKS